jgi:putative Holliday junction resolvase
MPNLICLDVGTVRIGVATADDKIRIAFPVETIVVDGHEFTRIADLASRYRTKQIVVGLPRNSSGAETEQSHYSRQFADKLVADGFDIHFMDESTTSIVAEERLRETKKSYTKSDIDKEAAAIILQDFLDSGGDRK